MRVRFPSPAPTRNPRSGPAVNRNLCLTVWATRRATRASGRAPASRPPAFGARPDARPAPRHPAGRSKLPIGHATRYGRSGCLLGLDVRRDAGGAPGRYGNRVLAGRPRDLPVVALGIGEVGIAALEELRVRRLLRHGGTGLASAPNEGID